MRENAAKRWSNICLVVGIIAFVLPMTDMHAFTHSYLHGFVFWLGIAFGSLLLLTLSHLIRGVWSTILRPVYAAAARTLPLFILLFIPIVLGLHEIYHHWARPLEELDPILQRKSIYLNETFFYIRAAIYFVIWTWLSRRMTRNLHGMDNIAGVAMILIALTGTFASIDWMMSLDPHWFSTIYGVIFCIGSMLSAHVFSILIVALLRRCKPDPLNFTTKRIHDLGTLMFAFNMLWMYMTLSQFLIIWSGNIPEEVAYYVPRLTGGWGLVAVGGFFLHFAIPFFLLLSKWIKQHMGRLLTVACLMLLMRFAEASWFILPSFSPGKFHLNWTDIVVPIGIGGIWLALFFRQLASIPMTPATEAHKRHH